MLTATGGSHLREQSVQITEETLGPTEMTRIGQDYSSGTMARIHVHEVMSSSVPIIRWVRSPNVSLAIRREYVLPFSEGT